MDAAQGLAEAFAGAPERFAALAREATRAADGQVIAWYAATSPVPCVWLVCPGLLRRLDSPDTGAVVDITIPAARVVRLVVEQSPAGAVVVAEVDAEPAVQRPAGDGRVEVLRAGWQAHEPPGSPQQGQLLALAEALRSQM